MQKRKIKRHPCVAKPKKPRAARLLPSLLLCLSLLLTSCTGREEEVKEPPAPPKGLTVYVDAGHGGFDLGAVGVTAEGERIAEKDLALSVATLIAKELRSRGHTVLLSRTGDERLTYTNSREEILARRAAAVAGGADLLLSVHANAYAGKGRAYGARVYHSPASQASAAAAKRLSDAVTEHTGALIGRECRVVEDGSFLVLGEEKMPSLLFEIGFLSDERELALLADPAYQARLARAVAEALA